MAEFKQLKTSFPIPEKLQEDIDALEDGVRNEVSHVDCLQEELRSMAHDVTGEDGLTEEQAEEIIDYYYRRRWF